MVAADACAAASDEAVWRCCDVASFQAAFANSYESKPQLRLPRLPALVRPQNWLSMHRLKRCSSGATLGSTTDELRDFDGFIGTCCLWLEL